MDNVSDRDVPKKKSHLQMIQGVVNRLAHNSFLLKGWSVVLVSALFALAVKDVSSFFVLLAFFPALVFWFLDGYFLWQERMFRALYDHVRDKNEEDIDFSMDVNEVEETREVSYFRAVFSKTLIAFHGAVLGSILVVSIAMLAIGT